jgi:hypothetical protein
MRLGILLVFIIVGVIPPNGVAAQERILAIENLSVIYQSQDYSEAKFLVVNRSARPILSYSVGLQYTSPDGQRTRDKALDGKRNMDVVSADFTTRFPDPLDPIAMTQKDQLLPVGPLLPGRKQEWVMNLRTGPNPSTVEPVVIFVVFDDNSVSGDFERAKSVFQDTSSGLR